MFSIVSLQVYGFMVKGSLAESPRLGYQGGVSQRYSECRRASRKNSVENFEYSVWPYSASVEYGFFCTHTLYTIYTYSKFKTQKDEKTNIFNLYAICGGCHKWLYAR